jgi:WD40 repeat protein
VIPFRKENVMALAISADGKRLAARSTDHMVCVWDKESLRMLAEAAAPPVDYRNRVHTMTFDPTSTVLVWGENNRLKRWDFGAGRFLEPFILPIEQIRLVAYGPDGRTLAVGGTAKDILIVDSTRGQTQCSLTGGGSGIEFLAFSPDGQRFVTAEQDKLLRLWDTKSFTLTANPTPFATLKGHTQEVFAAAFHPDGTRLASGGRDRIVHIWDIATGEMMLRMPGHANYIFSMAFSPDGRTLITGSGDYTVRIWDTIGVRDRLSSGRQQQSAAPETK